MCTYADNRLQILRCGMCGSVRGTSWNYFHGSAGPEIGSVAQSEARTSADAGKVTSKTSTQKGKACQTLLQFLLKHK